MRDWNRNDYNNAVGAITRWFWEPLSDNCKETVKAFMLSDNCKETVKMLMQKNGRSIPVSDYYNAICMCRMSMIAVEDDPEFDGYFYESDAENLDQLLSFVDQFYDQLRKFSVKHTMVIDED
jgi:hypothetical protein